MRQTTCPMFSMDCECSPVPFLLAFRTLATLASSGCLMLPWARPAPRESSLLCSAWLGSVTCTASWALQHTSIPDSKPFFFTGNPLRPNPPVARVRRSRPDMDIRTPVQPGHEEISVRDVGRMQPERIHESLHSEEISPLTGETCLNRDAQPKVITYPIAADHEGVRIGLGAVLPKTADWRLAIECQYEFAQFV